MADRFRQPYRTQLPNASVASGECSLSCTRRNRGKIDARPLILPLVASAGENENDQQPLRPYGSVNLAPGPVPEYISLHSSNNSSNGFKREDIARSTGRTPSPTPSEVNYLTEGKFDFRRLLTKEFWLKKETISELIPRKPSMFRQSIDLCCAQ